MCIRDSIYIQENASSDVYRLARLLRLFNLVLHWISLREYWHTNLLQASEKKKKKKKTYPLTFRSPRPKKCKFSRINFYPQSRTKFTVFDTPPTISSSSCFFFFFRCCVHFRLGLFWSKSWNYVDNEIVFFLQFFERLPRCYYELVFLSICLGSKTFVEKCFARSWF